MTSILKRIRRDGQAVLQNHGDKLPYAGIALVFLIFYIVSQTREVVTHVYRSDSKPDFKDARILGSSGDSLYEGKGKLLAKTMRELTTAHTQLMESNEKLQARLDLLEGGKLQPSPGASPLLAAKSNTGTQATTGQVSSAPSDVALEGRSVEAVRSGPPPEELPITRGYDSNRDGGSGSLFPQSPRYGSRIRRADSSGATIISFPVKDVAVEKTESIVLPSGSYVKGKLMTGVEAPEGKTYPVLLQLDYAYIVPNQNRLDLSGCFMIAKSQGDLSTERVQMQATKISCVSKEGRMFEREVNGFIADDKDNSFAVMGLVNSKQDRVAAMAFLSSIVEGIGKAIQQAQTTQQTTPLGGAQALVTGDQAKYLTAGGASNAATLVTQWYLKQAQNLLPTINVGSGQDVWIIMQDSVKLPHEYFRKGQKGSGGSGSVYNYFSRILD